MEPPRFYDRMTVGTLYVERAARALDFPRVADEAVRAFAAAGMRIARTTDPI